MVILMAETCWALNEYWINNKISGIKLVFSLLKYKDDARSHKHKFREMFGHLPSSVSVFLHAASFWTCLCYRLTWFIISIKFCFTVGMGLTAVTVRRCLTNHVFCHRFNQHLFNTNMYSRPTDITLPVFISDSIPTYTVNICILFLISLS